MATTETRHQDNTKRIRTGTCSLPLTLAPSVNCLFVPPTVTYTSRQTGLFNSTGLRFWTLLLQRIGHLDHLQAVEGLLCPQKVCNAADKDVH